MSSYDPILISDSSDEEPEFLRLALGEFWPTGFNSVHLTQEAAQDKFVAPKLPVAFGVDKNVNGKRRTPSPDVQIDPSNESEVSGESSLDPSFPLILT